MHFFFFNFQSHLKKVKLVQKRISISRWDQEIQKQLFVHIFVFYFFNFINKSIALLFVLFIYVRFFVQIFVLYQKFQYNVNIFRNTFIFIEENANSLNRAFSYYPNIDQILDFFSHKTSEQSSAC